MADRYLLESSSTDGYLLEDGSGVLSLDESVVIVNNANTTVTSLASYYRITDNSGTTTFDADAVSSASTSGDFVLRGQFVNATGAMDIGVSLNPTSGSGYTNIDRSLHYNPGDAVYGLELGLSPGGGASQFTTNISTANYYFIKRVGSAVTGWVGAGPDISTATQFVTFTDLSGAVYFDSSFSTLNNYAEVAFIPGNLTLALTGQAATVSQGSILATNSLALTGQAITAAQGSVLQGAPLTGQSVTAAQGSLTFTTTVALTGQSVSVARGSVVAAPSFALTGQSASIAQGSVLASFAFALSGQSASVARGTLTPGLSFALSGQSLSNAQGSVVPASTFALTGQSLTAAQGSLVAAPSFVLTGQSVSAAIGTATAVTTVALTGQSLAAAQGTVTAPSTDVTLVLTGLSLSASQGAFALETARALTGVAAFIAKASLTPQFMAELVGNGLVASQGRPGAVDGTHYRFWQPSPLTGKRRSVSRRL